MAREILIINGHDWSGAIQSSGYGWARSDLDSDKSTRTKDGRLRRDKIGTKRKITYEVMGLTRAEAVLHHHAPAPGEAGPAGRRPQLHLF